MGLCCLGLNSSTRGGRVGPGRWRRVGRVHLRAQRGVGPLQWGTGVAALSSMPSGAPQPVGSSPLVGCSLRIGAWTLQSPRWKEGRIAKAIHKDVQENLIIKRCSGEYKQKVCDGPQRDEQLRCAPGCGKNRPPCPAGLVCDTECLPACDPQGPATCAEGFQCRQPWPDLAFACYPDW